MTFPRALARHLRGTASHVALRLAGRAAMADLQHTGRRSGTVRHTPVRAFRKGDTVVIGLNFGRQSDWYQNVKAAGACRMRLGRSELILGAPTLVPVAEGSKDMPRLFGFALRHIVHTTECVRLPVVRTSPAPHVRRQRQRQESAAQRYEVRPVAWVESPLRHRAQAPRQGSEGAPPAWLAVEPEVAEGIRDLRAGEQVIVLTWLDRARRGELAAVPGDNPASPPLGVFSTRSPDRPNPIGLHRTQILAVEGLRILVNELEALDRTPVIDIKPVLDPVAER